MRGRTHIALAYPRLGSVASLPGGQEGWKLTNKASDARGEAIALQESNYAVVAQDFSPGELPARPRSNVGLAPNMVNGPQFGRLQAKGRCAP